MSLSRFIICEQSNRWAVAMRWALADRGIRVHEAGDWHYCRRELACWPASIVGLEACLDNLEDVVGRLLWLQRNFPQARAVVFSCRDLCDALAVLYEAGAVHVVESTRNLDATARLVRRLLERAATAEGDYYQKVRDRLPW